MFVFDSVLGVVDNHIFLKMDIKFNEFCELCERICASDKKKKLELLQKFMRNFQANQREHPEQTFFPIIRLLLPQLDRARGAYGIKEVSLAKLYVKIFCLPTNGADAHRLMTYRYLKLTNTVFSNYS